MNNVFLSMTIYVGFLVPGILCAQDTIASKLQLIVSGKEVALPADVIKQVTLQVEAVVESSNFDSIHQPDIFRAPRTSSEHISKDSCLRLIYPQPHTFKTVGGVLTADQVDVGLTMSGIPDPWLLRNKEQVIELAKYSGEKCVHLARMPGFTEHLPKSMQEKLPAYNRIP